MLKTIKSKILALYSDLAYRVARLQHQKNLPVRTKDRSTLFFCYTANPPERPDLCTQFWNDIYPQGELLLSEDLIEI